MHIVVIVYYYRECFHVSSKAKKNKSELTRISDLEYGLESRLCLAPSSLQYSIICSDGVDLTHLNEFSSCDSNS